MKRTLIMFLMLICLHTGNHYGYEQTIQDQAQIWKETYVTTLTNPIHMQTLIDIILLSYQLARESCHMTIAKLILQEELFKIHTPSLIDSWQTNMQVLQNDTTKLELALTHVKICQQRFGEIFDQLKLVATRLIQINPQPTQTLITDLKKSLLAWTKQQHEIALQIDEVQHEFTAAIATITDIKNFFSITLHTTELKKTHLKEGAGCVSRSYKDIESVFDHFTKIRKTSMYKFEQFFTFFFKTYYTTLYKMLPEDQVHQYQTIALDCSKLPLPDDFFTISAIL